jgi:nicotinate dehydrogenase subunit A
MVNGKVDHGDYRISRERRAATVEADPETPLLYTLADDLELNGPKFGCGQAQCGSCTVLMDGEPTRCCVVPVKQAAGREILTIESKTLRVLQNAFIEEQAVQCGFCLSGPMLQGKAFIDKNPNASEAEILRALSGLICRCYAHVRMVKALQRYAREIRK